MRFAMSTGFGFIIALTLYACGSGGDGGSSETKSAQSPPYPPTQVISGISWDFDNLVRKAPGSDLWPITWAADNNLYTSWGDGGGFNGTNSKGRVSLGFARITGFPPSINGKNLWGDNRGYAENPATFCGKSGSMLSVDGVLYAWVYSYYNDTNNSFFVKCGANPNPIEIRLAWSSNLGSTWQQSPWKFTLVKGQLSLNSFLNFGKDYAGARDTYVYVYGRITGDNTNIYLARVPRNKIKDNPILAGQTSYEFFSGLDAAGTSIWTTDSIRAKPVFSDPNGVGGMEVVYNPVLERYIGTIAHGGQVGKLGVFDAPEPWGPWTTVAYYDNWGGFGTGEDLGYHFPTKWISEDGKTMWMVFSGGNLDSFNLLRATLTLKTQ